MPFAGYREPSKARLGLCPGRSLCLPARRIAPGSGLIFGPRCCKLGAGDVCGGGWGRSVTRIRCTREPAVAAAAAAASGFFFFFLTWNFHMTKRKRFLPDLMEPLASISDAEGVSSGAALLRPGSGGRSPLRSGRCAPGTRADLARLPACPLRFPKVRG